MPAVKIECPCCKAHIYYNPNMHAERLRCVSCGEVFFVEAAKTIPTRRKK